MMDMIIGFIVAFVLGFIATDIGFRMGRSAERQRLRREDDFDRYGG